MPSAAAIIKGNVPLLSLPPPDHVRLLHPTGRIGKAAIANVRQETWEERVVSLDDLPIVAREVAGHHDTYISQQSFFGWRRIASLAQLGACYVDLDYHTTRYSNFPPETVTAAVMLHLSERDIPPPTYVLSTGRGLLCVWLHDLVPRHALPRWQAIQRTLAESLRPFGADWKALDAARVFRIVGTVNSKTGTAVRPTWIGPIVRWSFDDLANEILPFSRAEVHLLAAKRAERRAERPEAVGKPTRTLTQASYWETVLTDLQKLRRHRWFGDLPPGHRDAWLLIACNAMSWLAPPCAVQREFHALAAEVGGWTSKECDSRMATVFKRAHLASQGVTFEWQGRQVDPRYRFKATTIIEWLRIEPEEMRQADLRVLIDTGIRRERDRERWHERREAAGKVDRATYEATAHQKAEDILRMLDRLGSTKAVAEALGITYEVAKKRIQRARRR